MSKRHNYEYDIDLASTAAPAHVIKMVGDNKRVLEIGCGPGSITKQLVEQGHCRVVGLELDAEAIEKVSPYCERVLQADLNSNEWVSLLDDTDKFDVLVAADVLEHLYDPWTNLKRMTQLLKQEGYMVISLPHVGHAAIMSCLINGDFEYRDWGLLDKTHIRFFGLKNIEELFAKANLKIVEARYTIKPPEETEFVSSWSKLSKSLQETLMRVPHAAVYQVVVKVKRLDEAGDVISLMPPPYYYQHQVIPSIASWKARIGQHLSPTMKQKIRTNLNRVGIKL